MSDFTPGPWSAARINENNQCCWQIDLNGKRAIAHTQQRTRAIYDLEDEANAHLIAAAPELLAALKAMLTIAKNDRWKDALTGRQIVYEAAENAVAKAENRATIQSAGGGK